MIKHEYDVIEEFHPFLSNILLYLQLIIFVLKKCGTLLPTFILFSNYFRVRPVLHLQKLAQRIASNVMDDMSLNAPVVSQ